MALHGNKPIRLTYSNNRIHYPAVTTNGRNAVDGSRAANSDTAERRRRLRIARIRRLRQQRLQRLRSTTTTEATTTTLPPTTTTTIPTTTIPTLPESTTSWYDSWLLEETQPPTPSSYTDTVDYYDYKIDDY